MPRYNGFVWPRGFTKTKQASSSDELKSDICQSRTNYTTQLFVCPRCSKQENPVLSILSFHALFAYADNADAYAESAGFYAHICGIMRIISAYSTVFRTHICDRFKFLMFVETLL